MKNNIQHYILSLLFVLVLPLFPLIIDGIYSSNANMMIRERSLTLAASLFAITRGVTSKEPLIFGLTVIISIFLTSIYGSIDRDAMVSFIPSLNIKPQTAVILGVIVSQVFERWTIHVVNNQPFLTFNKDE